MRSNNSKIYILLFFFSVLPSGCGNNSDTGASGNSASPTPSPLPAQVIDPTAQLTNGLILNPISGNNVLPFTVNGSNCNASDSYPNKPCVSVTICPPNATTVTSACQTISDILLDTGSYGLRIFSTAIKTSLTQITTGSGSLTECAEFGSGSDWGPVKLGAVQLGGEPFVNVPIQVINSKFSKFPSSCGTPDTGPTEAGFTGILGVGLGTQDCPECVTNATQPQNYYSCNGTTCTGVTVPLTNQVQNPVALLPTDNNGVILELPQVPLGGLASVGGYLVLGIGTQSNNMPSGVTAYSADPNTFEFSTTFAGINFPSFIDSGSNGLFFTQTTSLANCNSFGSNYAGWFCPASATSLTAINTAISGTVGSTVPFQIGNYFNLLNSSNSVFVEIGSNQPSLFDWGLPFYFGRNVYIGIVGASSSLGTGPYWAY